MKVTRNDKFEPITIVIESEEEAQTLWHRLNNPSIHMDDYLLTTPWDKSAYSDIAVQNMFEALDEVYCPDSAKNRF